MQNKKAQAQIALAQVLSVSGNQDKANSLLAEQAGDYARHEDVLLSIAASQLERKDLRQQTKQMLSEVCIGSKNATAAKVYLGDLEFAEQHYQEALDYYLSAQHRAPAWMIPLERSLQCYQMLKMHKQEEDAQTEINRRLKVLQHLAK